MPDDARSIDPQITIFETTREAWLNRIIEFWRPYFDRLGYRLPAKIWVSVGFPKGPKHLGECYPTYASDDGGIHIFVHPVVSDSLRVAGIIVHELCHAALDCEGGHGAAFQKLAKAMGLVAGRGKQKWTATIEGPAFMMATEGMVERIGPYPHATLRSNQRQKGRKDQRLIKVLCPTCRFALWSSAKWLTIVEPPTCLNSECESFGEAMDIAWPERETGEPVFEKADVEN